MAQFDHAIVIGASIGGLIAARVLSDRYRSVTVLERDACPLEIGARPGAAHARHAHVLLPSGAAVLDQLFAGQVDELIRNGSKRCDYGHFRFHLIGRWKPRVTTGMLSLVQSRPLLEESVRRWVAKIGNVRLIYETPVVSLLWDDSRGAVIGVKTAPHKCETDLMADLTIDASGRGTRLPRWLEECGCGTVPESRLELDLAYTTGKFRVPGHLMPDAPVVYIVGKPPLRTRAGAMISIEQGLLTVGVAGYHGDHPAGDMEGMLAFAKGLCAPDIYRVLSAAEPVAPLARFRFPHAVRRHYSFMRRFPHGILPIGDAACSLDPVFGQGMSVAALEAQALAATSAREYLKRMDRIIDTPWHLARGESLKYRQTPGRRPLSFHLTRTYRDRIGASGDAYVTSHFFRVLALMAPPETLLRPRIIARALFAAAISTSQVVSTSPDKS